MTYCVALRLEAGLVMLADTRTNAGVDNISTFRKLSVLEHPGD
ncbi:MAG: peptidase, partial [Parvibaculum sp.]|nr:peptidase [Parvibaculum sp.]